MIPTHSLSIATAIQVLVVGGCCIRILLRRHRQPESRIAWLAVTLALPYAGVLA